MKRWVLLVALAGCGDAKEDATRAGKRVEREARDLVDTAKQVKRELDKVYKSTKDYDVILEEGPSLDEHQQELARLPHVSVGGVDVAYEETSSLSLNGVSYAKHFRATWRRGDRVIAVSYYSQERIDAKAFAALLGVIVPAVEKQL
jgi:hypothetical protein